MLFDYKNLFRFILFIFFTSISLLNFALYAQTDTLKISWNLNDSTEDVTHYELHRVIGNFLADTALALAADSFFTRVDSTNGIITNSRILYVDTTRKRINSGRLISYRVKAVNDSGLSSPLSNAGYAGIPIISWPALPDSVILIPYITSIIPYDTVFPGSINFLHDPDHNDSQLIIDTVECINAVVVSDTNQRVLRISAEPGNLVETASVILEARDPIGFYDRDTLEFYFSLNNAPRIVNFTPIRIIRIDSLYQYQVQATDPDPGDVLTFSLPVAPGFLSINSTSGLISGRPMENDSGQHNITVRVEDQTGLFDSRNYTLTVTDTVMFTNAPEIISTPVMNAYINAPYQYSVIATDEDPGDILIFTLPTAPPFLGIASQSDTSAIISGTPSAANVGQFTVTVIATDVVGLADTQSYQITVADTSSPPPPESANDPIVFPNPFRASLDHHEYIFIDPIPIDATAIMIITPDGKLVYEQPVYPLTSRRFVWNVRKQQIASGLYIYIFKDSGDNKVFSGKIAIIR
jgi:hypothetical protein